MATQARTGTPLVELRDISIAFGGIRAVDHVSVDLYPGEVVGLLGHNGAGKSTLIKCLSGAYRMDAGEIFINGQPVTIENPRDARTLQHRDDLPDARAGRQPRRRLEPVPGPRDRDGVGMVDDAAMEAETRKIMARLNPNFRKFGAPVSALSGGQRQSVAIARAVYFNAKILIMDEPTAALGPQETQMVAELIQELKRQGLGIFLIDHDVHDGEGAVRPGGGDEERQARRRREGRRGDRGRHPRHDHRREEARASGGVMFLGLDLGTSGLKGLLIDDSAARGGGGHRAADGEPPA